MKTIEIYYQEYGHSNRIHHFQTSEYQTRYKFHAFLPLAYDFDAELISFHCTDKEGGIPITDIPNLHKMTEEELFQAETVWDYPVSFEMWMGFQRKVYEMISNKYVISLSTYEVE